MLSLVIKYRHDIILPDKIKTTICEMTYEDFENLSSYYGIQRISESNKKIVYNKELKLKVYRNLYFVKILGCLGILPEDVYK